MALGVYLPRAPGQPRLPIGLDGQPVADRVMLRSVEMISAP